MFGLNEISWDLFIRFIISGLVIWYFTLLLILWLKGKNKPTLLYEENNSTRIINDNIDPIRVSSKELPSQLISAVSESFIPLEVSRYEEVWPEDGYHINYFLDENSGELVKIQPEIQYQY